MQGIPYKLPTVTMSYLVFSVYLDELEHYLNSYANKGYKFKTIVSTTQGIKPFFTVLMEKEA